jgi:hypothetical protein
MNATDELIYLDVSGVPMKTYKSTLMNSIYFKSYFDRWSEDKTDKKEIFIDFDPKIFVHVLNILRNHTYIVPNKHIVNVNIMLEYYGIEKIKEIKEITKINKKIKLCKSICNGSLSYYFLLQKCHKIEDFNYVIDNLKCVSIQIILYNSIYESEKIELAGTAIDKFSSTINKIIKSPSTIRICISFKRRYANSEYLFNGIITYIQLTT